MTVPGFCLRQMIHKFFLSGQLNVDHLQQAAQYRADQWACRLPHGARPQWSPVRTRETLCTWLSHQGQFGWEGQDHDFNILLWFRSYCEKWIIFFTCVKILWNLWLLSYFYVTVYHDLSALWRLVTCKSFMSRWSFLFLISGSWHDFHWIASWCCCRKVSPLEI